MIILTISLILLCIYLSFHLLSLKRGLKQLRKDFKTIKRETKAERHLQIKFPDSDLEALAKEMNDYISEFYTQVDRKRKDLEHLKEEITNLSHDLRTPLTSIMGYVDLLSEEELTQEQKEVFDVIKRRSHQLNELVEQLYEYARLGNEDYAFHMEKLDILRMLKEQILDAYTEFERNDISLEINLPETTKPWYVMLDSLALKRVLTNLISNTVKYAKHYAKISLLENQGMMELSFCTNRGELTDYDIAHLFERYYKKEQKEAIKKPSSGLGLTITKLFVEQMGGIILAKGDADNLTITLYFARVKQVEELSQVLL